MASLTVCMVGSSVKIAAATRVTVKKSAKKEEPKNFFQFVSETLDKNPILETDPVLQKTDAGSKKSTTKKSGFTIGGQ